MKKLIFPLLLALAFTSCKKDELDEPDRRVVIRAERLVGVPSATIQWRTLVNNTVKENWNQDQRTESVTLEKGDVYRLEVRRMFEQTPSTATMNIFTRTVDVAEFNLTAQLVVISYPDVVAWTFTSP